MEFRDLKVQYQKYKMQIDAGIQEVLSNANFINGEEVITLEKRLAKYIGVKHCISCANGTDALSLLMMAWNIGEGDAVFVPDFTFFSTAEIVSFCGATPVFVDVNRDTYNLDTKKLEMEISRIIDNGNLNPKVIIPVDLFGLPANYEEIQRIANKYGLLVLEDGAQGFGGSVMGEKACSFGDASTTSFFPAKPLGCYGDGGAVFTNDDELAKTILSIRVHGKGDSKYDNIRIGINSRLDTIQAAILNVKLSAFINHELSDVIEIGNKYNEYLKGTVEIPFIPEGYISSYAQYTIKLNSSHERNQLKSYLSSRGIPTMIYYHKPMRKQEAFSNLLVGDENRVTDELCEKVLSLPMHPYLEDQDIKSISDAIKDFIAKNRN